MMSLQKISHCYQNTLTILKLIMVSKVGMFLTECTHVQLEQSLFAIVKLTYTTRRNDVAFMLNIYWLSWLYTTPTCLRISSSTSASRRESAWDMTALSFSPAWENHTVTTHTATLQSARLPLRFQCFCCHLVLNVCIAGSMREHSKVTDD